jgi:hypothetical protein
LFGILFPDLHPSSNYSSLSVLSSLSFLDLYPLLILSSLLTPRTANQCAPACSASAR